MNRTAIIYQPDLEIDEYIMVLIYIDRAPIRRKYDNIRDMQGDLLYHIGDENPRVLYGTDYRGPLTNLIVGIVVEDGRLNIRYNPVIPAGKSVCDIFRNLTVRQLLNIREAARCENMT